MSQSTPSTPATAYRVWIKLRGSWTPTDSVAAEPIALRPAYRQWCLHYAPRSVAVRTE